MEEEEGVIARSSHWNIMHVQPQHRYEHTSPDRDLTIGEHQSQEEATAASGFSMEMGRQADREAGAGGRRGCEVGHEAKSNPRRCFHVFICVYFSYMSVLVGKNSP